jgi:hypothetical protein
MLALDGAAPTVDRASPLVTAAQRLVSRIEVLVDDVAKLRAENAALRAEVRAAVALLDGAGTAAGGSPGGRRAARAVPATRRRRRARAPKGRATPTDVTSDVVRAVLVKLGEGTAAEIAAEITRARTHAGVTAKAGEAIGGRAVRFLAERAGATSQVSEDGQRRYRLG